MAIEDFASSTIKGLRDYHSTGSRWSRSLLPKVLGHGFADQLVLEAGLTLAYTHYEPKRDLLEEHCIERSMHALMIAIALEGESSTRDADGRRFDFIAGHSTIAVLKNVQGTRCFPANQTIRQLRIIVSEPLLQRYGLEHMLHRPNSADKVATLYLGQHYRLMTQLANSVVALHNRSGSLLDLQIATLSLLAEQIKPLSILPSGTRKMTANDQAKLQLARDILMSQYDQPLTVAYLCTVVGLNEFKLKQGFRQVFDTSPHRMLTDIRMQQALRLLETANHVSSVAYQVGFQHLSSFSVAFERYYGRTPKSVLRRKDQQYQ